jgi:hypothetical protein
MVCGTENELLCRAGLTINFNYVVMRNLKLPRRCSMAIYGIGAYYDEDVSSEFLSKEVACVGWGSDDAPSLHRLLEHITVGDLIYIKSYPPDAGLSIKAVGIVVDDEVKHVKNLGMGVKVKWIWRGDEFMGKIGDKYHVRLITLYEEFNLDIQKKVIQLLLNPNYPKIKRK